MDSIHVMEAAQYLTRSERTNSQREKELKIVESQESCNIEEMMGDLFELSEEKALEIIALHPWTGIYTSKLFMHNSMVII